MRNHRQWIQATIAHEETGVVPYNFMFSPSARRKVEERYGAPVEEALGFPIRMTGPRSVKPLYAEPAKFGPTLKDEFGVVWTTSEMDRGAPVKPCLAAPSLTDYRFPDAASADRFEEIGPWCEEHKGSFTVVWVGDLWERATFMRGMEALLLDLVFHAGFVEELLRGITDYVLRTMEILFARFRFDGVALSDDYGTQKAMLMSPAHWRRLIKPRLLEIYAFARRHGRVVFHHSCGDIQPIIRDLIDIGLDILHPIQPEAMDVFRLKKEFGRDLTLCGGIRTQDLLPRGKPDEVREEVRRLQEEMGRGGGYILEPGITIQADVPIENMVAMIEEAMGE